MATITLKYDARNVSVKKALELLFTLGVTEENKPKKKMSGIEKSLDDIKNGRVHSAKSVEDMMNKILK